jgi:hypothetical protein
VSNLELGHLGVGSMDAGLFAAAGHSVPPHAATRRMKKPLGPLDCIQRSLLDLRLIMFVSLDPHLTPTDGSRELPSRV